MDSDREERLRAIAEADRLNADFDRDEWRRAQRQKLKRSVPAEIVRKTYEPRPAQQQSSAPMDSATQAGWDTWVRNHIEIALKEYSEAVVDAIGEAMSEYVYEHLKEETTKLRKESAEQIASLREEIGGVRIDSAVSRSILRGEINGILAKKKARA